MSAPAQSVFPGYAMPGGSYTAPPRVHHTSHTRLVLMLGAGLTVLAVAVVAISASVAPTAARYVCPPDCGEPPIGQPVERLPRFTAPGGEFSVSYPRAGAAYAVTMRPDGVELDFTAGDGGTMQLFSQMAGNRTPQEIAAALLAHTYPDAIRAYEIPNAMVGYHLGYGEVDDVYPTDFNGEYVRLRALVMVAVKNGLALIAAASGPYHQFTPDFGTGQPSGVNLQLALDMGKYVNSFRWRDDPPR